MDTVVADEETGHTEFSLLRVTQLRRLEPAPEPLSDAYAAEMR